MKRIGIIGAMDLEVAQLKEWMQVKEIVTKASMDFYVGELGGRDAVVVRCGIGKVNAALCVQILADIFEVTHIINTGVAGSLNAALDIGDILISKDVLHHDVDVTIFGYQLGEVPQMGFREFQADEGMIDAAMTACREVNPGLHVRTGRVVSGDQFISDKEVKQRLITTFAGDCTEMEGASIAHSSYLNGIPFVIIRAISDKADDSAEMDYPTFEREAASHCAALVAHMLTLL